MFLIASRTRPLTIASRSRTRYRSGSSNGNASRNCWFTHAALSIAGPGRERNKGRAKCVRPVSQRRMAVTLAGAGAARWRPGTRRNHCLVEYWRGTGRVRGTSQRISSMRPRLRRRVRGGPRLQRDNRTREPLSCKTSSGHFGSSLRRRRRLCQWVSFPPVHGHPRKRDNARGVSHVIKEEKAATVEAKVHA